MSVVETVKRQHAEITRIERGRLFRKYFLLILALVCGALLISGGIGLYFAYQENKAALASLQREKAVSAAARIEQFVRQIEQQLAFAALPQLGVEGLEQRRIEFLKLLRVVPAVTDIAQIDPRGREQLTVSRLRMDTAGAETDRAQDPAFKNARPGQTWFGPVYFRKETEPYMTIAVRSGGEQGPVTVAEVNLKFIWDVVTRIKVGQKGKAYVVDGSGYLVADPDIGLVLRKTDLSGLEQVKAALAPGADDAVAMVARDIAGHSVLTAHAPVDLREDKEGRKVDPLGWKVFVEQPVAEVFQALDATIIRTVALIIAGLLFSALAAMWLARSMARPISILQEGAARIGAGDLDTQIHMKTGDELESLADQFNRMTGQLRESYSGLERKVEERTGELQQTLEQQTATSEILRVISSSPTDTQPVFEAIVQSGLKLFPGALVSVALRYGDAVNAAAVAAPDPDRVEAWRRTISRTPLARNYMHGAALLDRRVVDIPDVAVAPAEFVAGAQNFLTSGNRAITIMPMMRGDEAIGVLSVVRLVPGALSDKQLALLRTFADQAVIAIENVRLFNETKESLEQQTATSEILRVISGSPTDVGPVFDSIISNAVTLSQSRFGAVYRYDGELIHLTGHHNFSPDALASVQARYPQPADGRSLVARAIRAKAVVHVPDVETDPSVPAGSLVTARTMGYRSQLVVPMMRDQQPIGAIVVARAEPGGFPVKQIELVQTFADQAVIAIENVRLFNETKESLEQQTAISEILRVISSSPSDVQPVFDAVAERAARICGAQYSDIVLAEGAVMRVVAGTGNIGRTSSSETVPLDRSTVMGRSIIDRLPVQIADLLQHGDEFPRGRELALQFGHRCVLAVPLLRGNNALGTILLRRNEVRPFEDRHVALLKTFADQAAIAIENTRLFNETKEALAQQTSISEVLRAISDSQSDVKPVLDAVADRATRLCDATATAIYVLEGDTMRRTAFNGPAELEGTETLPYSPGTLTGRAVAEGKAIHVEDMEQARDLYPVSWERAQRFGQSQTMLAVPLLREGKPFGAMFLRRTEVRPFNDKQIALATTFADQAAIAIENVRLFREIQEKSAQLEVANKHKSDFLANMSHELRTPLNAIIGFSEVLMEKMFGDVNTKQADYLKDIHESGRHLLSLINDILDLSKIEAGKMDLELSTFHLPTAISNAMALIRERAQRHSIQLGTEVDPRLGEFQGDERKLKQIMLNLLSNAVKFTPDGGRVDVSAKLDTTVVEIAVKDTGIGIAPEDQKLVFEEFRQVGRDVMRKAEGTGLGLALTKKFVELHGGRIGLASSPGKGSTFTVTLPIRQ